MPDQLFEKLDEILSPVETRVCLCSKLKNLGFAMSSKTLTNRDSRGTGIPGAFRSGNRVYYPKDQILEWLRKQAC